jgi:hypothetical protein
MRRFGNFWKVAQNLDIWHWRNRRFDVSLQRYGRNELWQKGELLPSVPRIPDLVCDPADLGIQQEFAPHLLKVVSFQITVFFIHMLVFLNT